MRIGKLEIALNRASYGYLSVWNYGSTGAYRFVNLGRVNIAWRLEK